ncbi:hypothetical protein PLICRDRAFT_475097 [Plicaturopsis crispa FD-325 SS-3]|nr:hypothetical protein PLICRDRAFT_475097 [Plicaturopsis crispa FD-325 SS-3]
MEPFDDADESNIVDFENRAKELEATEHDLLQQLQQVRYTLAHLRSRITSYLINRRAPIARLPAEILAKIFWFGDPTYKREGPLPSPVIFSHVSRHWRRVAIDTPMLWSRIHSVADTWVKHPYPHALLDAHLERSRTCRLDIDCDIDIDFFIEKIVYHIQRWSSYTFRSYGVNSTAAALSHIQALAPLCAPALRRLTVRDIPDASSDALFTGGLPRISSLTIRNSRKMMMDIIAPVAFNMLTHLKITTTFDEAYTLTKIQDVLAQTPLLIDLAIVCRRLEIDNCRETPVALPALRKFGLGMIRFEHLPHYTRQVFSAIAAPALEICTIVSIIPTHPNIGPHWYSANSTTGTGIAYCQTSCHL